MNIFQFWAKPPKNFEWVLAFMDSIFDLWYNLVQITTRKEQISDGKQESCSLPSEPSPSTNR